MTFSAAYMQKITEIFVANNKPNVDAVNRVLQDFKSKQSPRLPSNSVLAWAWISRFH
jgi:hypothetical protein